jgi:hypothetical protein
VGKAGAFFTSALDGGEWLGLAVRLDAVERRENVTKWQDCLLLIAYCLLLIASVFSPMYGTETAQFSGVNVTVST